MMFMTPTPPTSSEIAAMPVSSTVSVLLVEFAVSTSDSWVAMLKSASSVGDAVPGEQQALDLLVRRAAACSAEAAST